MAHIVILGAGTGGMSGAYEIREALKDNEHTITLINEREEFQFVPSNPWIAVGWRDERETTIPIKKYVNKKTSTLLPPVSMKLSQKITNWF